ncbi:L-ascorbate-6-phosphate lactonase UlaG [mine drainage metagenome]|uniref:L-ascorbate-6-phosphate lactonase UlaG n=1 Tax=mine drainage metagenome TaxID=410659 RepID=A0A1J5RAR4_9ZZZZ
METDLTFWGHACVQLARADRSLLIDPGSFSDRTCLETVDAVLVTHEHVDHVLVDELAAVVANHSHLEVWAPGHVVDQLLAADAPGERLHVVQGGDRFTAAGFEVAAEGELHALIHADVPRVANVAFIIDGAILHPGDSFTRPGAGEEIAALLAPVSAPWLSVGEVIDFVRAVRPGLVIPIHSALLSDAGNDLVDRLVAGMGRTGYRRLAMGETITIQH